MSVFGGEWFKSDVTVKFWLKMSRIVEKTPTGVLLFSSCKKESIPRMRVDGW